MSDEKPTREESGDLNRASDIFFAVREMDPAAQDDAIARECGDDQALAQLVRLLLRGDRAPLPVEGLADDIRAAQETRTSDEPSKRGLHGSDSTAGTSIGNFRILERLGEGGFGVVYLAEQERPVRRRVALKIIKLGMDTKQVVARFEAERQALAMMDHPGIAKVFDAGATESGRPYFVMELVRGLTITEYCDRHSLSIRDRLELLAQVCDALQHAHQKGVIHRDIKPSNVLVTLVGDKPVPKVIDFGVAKATTARLTEKTVYTEFRQMIGTPEYMSPEQSGWAGASGAAGPSADDIDTRADVYAAGVLLYELLTGATPFDSRRLRSAAYGEIQRIIREEDPPKPSTRISAKPETLATVAQQRSTPPTKLTSVIEGELDWIVMKAIEKDRTRRYDSAGSFGRDIRRYLSGEAVQAAPPSRTYLARKFVRRHRGPVIAAALVVGVLIAGLVGTSLGFLNAETQRKVAVVEKKRADTKAEEALSAEAVASRHAYSANMLSACQALALNQTSIVRSHLEAAPERWRGWEWRVLMSRLDTSVRSLPCAMSGWKPGEDPRAYKLIPHPDGRSFFTSRAYESDALQRWDVADGTLLAHYPRPSASQANVYSSTRAAIASDGNRLTMFCGIPGTSTCAIEVWNLQTNASIARQDVPANPPGEGLNGVSPDGRVLVRGPESGRVSLQDVATGSVLGTSERGVSQWGTFSPDGHLYACSDERGTLQLFDAHTFAPLSTLRGHSNIIDAATFSVDGRTLATGSIDTTARIWNVAANPPTCVVLEHPCAVEEVSLSSDGSTAATIGSDHAIRVWNARTGEQLGLCTNDRLIAGAVMAMPDGRTVAGRERDGTVRFWDITADAAVNLQGHKGYINAALLAEKPDIIVSAGWDGWHGAPGCLRLWDARTGDEIAAVGRPGEVAYTLAVSRDGRYAAAGLTQTDGPWTPKAEWRRSRVLLIDLETPHVVVVDSDTLESSYGRVFGIACDPTGEFVALGRKGCIEIRRTSTGELVRRRTEGLTDRVVNCVAWSPDGRTIACFPSLSEGRSIGDEEPSLLLNATTLATEHSFKARSPYCLVFSRDSSRVLAGGRDAGIVRAFDTRTGSPLSTFQAHDGLVNAIAMSPDGTRLATVGGDEGDIIVWDTTTLPPYERVARFHEAGFVSGAVWGSAGNRLIGACDKTIRIWDETPLRERVMAREDRKQALSHVEPIVAGLFDELHEAANVVERLNADHTLTPMQRRAAHQLVLKHELDHPRNP